MTTIQKGFRCKLDDYVNPTNEITVEMTVSGQSVYDYSCFGVDSANKLSDDRYMIFYNQISSPANEITLSQNTTGAIYRVNISRLPSSINKLVFTVSIDGNGTMSGINQCSVNIGQSGNNKLQFNLAGSDFQNEKAIIAIEIYRKDVWRLATVGSGFNGGLADLLKTYGGEEATPVSVQTTTSQPASSKISLEKRLEKDAPALVSLAKPLKISLEKHKLTDTTAKVALVLDISGSMSHQYQNGTVQEIVNKTLPLAVQFDDDGEIDFWYYGSRCQRMDAVNMRNYKNAVPTSWHNLMRSLGFGNHEPTVMREIVTEYKKSQVPAYVLFITDGSVSNENDIKRLIIESSKMPIFWQFVGVGGRGYGVLERLDTMSGRYVDNANFFALDDFRKVSNEKLYDRLLTEFPQWLKEIRIKKIIS
ncbi:MAG: VWA domain-containing protein [Planctomycetaceae bacterium]|jgi:stress response protein SCP2|nr:VWA domain-containing protein [Planctomycetaceae bacterium]